MSHPRAILIASWAVIGVIDFVLRVNTTWPDLLRAVPSSLMQWMVLQLVAGVGWPWAAIAVASRAAFDAFAPVALPVIGAAPLGMLLAVPAAFLLSRHSRRGWWWIAAPAIGYLLTSLVPVEAASPRTTINLILARRLAVGALEGALLAYILSEVLAARSTAAGRASRPHTSVPAVLAAMMALSVCIFVVVSFGDLPAGGRPAALTLAFCNLAGLVLLLPPQTRGVGAGLAFGTALVTVLTTTYLFVLGALFAAFASGAAAILLMAVPIMQIIQIVQGYRAVRAEGPDMAMSWIVGVLGPLGLIAMLTVIAV